MSEQMHHAYATGLQARARGEARGRAAKLTDDAVREIRRLYRPRTSSTRELAERFGVSMACVQSVIRGDRWTHL